MIGRKLLTPSPSLRGGRGVSWISGLYFVAFLFPYLFQSAEALGAEVNVLPEPTSVRTLSDESTLNLKTKMPRVKFRIKLVLTGIANRSLYLHFFSFSSQVRGGSAAFRALNFPRSDDLHIRLLARRTNRTPLVSEAVV